MIAASRRPEGFDARRDARSRTYCYRVLASPVRHPFEDRARAVVAAPARREALDRCAAALVGTHDFTAFTPTETEHVRFERDVIRAEWRAQRLAEPFPGELLELWIEADAFMRHMVRVLVGTMLEVAGGRRSAEDFEALLAAPRASAPARRRPRTASTWRRCATELARRPRGRRSSTSPRLAGRSGRNIEDPVASTTGLPSAFSTVARVIAIVRPAWITSARAVRSRPSGITGRR